MGFIVDLLRNIRESTENISFKKFYFTFFLTLKTKIIPKSVKLNVVKYINNYDVTDQIITLNNKD